MLQLWVLLLAPAATPTSKLHLLGAGEGGNACLDGTPFGYYIGQNTSSADWVIDIEGGGWCGDAAACHTRNTRLSSSSTWGPVTAPGGIASADPAVNPKYHTYNRVVFPYCDGSSFTSYRETPYPYTLANGTVVYLHMRGKANMVAALQSLKRDYGMVNVDNFVITGGSAGGLSTFIHTDELGALAGARATVGMPDAGAFRVVSPGCCDWEGIVTLHNSTGSLNARCVAAQPAGSAWKCFTVPTLHPFLSSPLFVLQSQFDHFQLSAMASVPCAIAQAYYPPWSLSPKADCTTADNATIAAYGAGWFADFKALLAQDNIASFITSCIAHEERGTAGWTSLVAGGDSMRDAFAQWHGAVSAGSIPPRTQWIEDSRQLPTNGNRAVCAPLWAESTLRLSGGNHQNAPQHNSQELWARIYRQQHKFEAAEHF